MWAIVGSSGFEHFEQFEVIETLSRETPFGLCAEGFYRVKVAEEEALFLCRNGEHSQQLPSHVNHRANIYAIKAHGANAMLALSSVCSVRDELCPGEMVVPYQFIDRSKGGRKVTFCEDGLLAYISLTHPICEKAANILKEQRDTFAFQMHFGQAYVCIDGPQFPTMIDARCFQAMGGGIIGMSSFPEFALAREAGIHYLPCHFVVDYVPWAPEVNNVGAILDVRHQNHIKALALCRWVVTNLGQFAEHDRSKHGLVNSINAANLDLTDQQMAWLRVLGDGVVTGTQSTNFPELSQRFPHACQPIPETLQTLINFVNKYAHDSDYTVDTARKESLSLHHYAGDGPDIASVKTFSIKGQTRSITVRCYHPSPHSVLPAIVYAHGGGFISGDLTAFDAFCRGLADVTQQAVIAVEYALAPEHPYPAGVDDVYDVCVWLVNHGQDLKVATDALNLIGDSGGGNFAAVVTARAIQSRAFQVNNLVLIYPSVDLTHDVQSMETFAVGYLVEASKVRYHRAQYVPQGMDNKNPELSPYYSDQLAAFPNTMIVSAAYDPLRDEALLFADKLSREGVRVVHKHFPTMIHGFINFAKLVPDEMTTLYGDIRDFLQADH